MADMFGRWVPEEWIEAVLSQMRASPQWNFLCLTKFPKRMAEFDIPPNTWMGTTVDLQARVPAAEAAFAKVKAAVKWLSVEPMLEPLKFTRLDLFDWIVVGGASRSTKTPAWHPPSQWVHDLRRQADAAGVAWYEKKNLWSADTARTLQLPNGLPVTPDDGSEPEPIFRYLGKAKTADQKAEE
jgi:protein gp37